MPRASYQESSLSIKSIIVCLSNHSPTHGVQPEAILSDSDEKYIFTIQDSTKYPETTVPINVEWFKVIVDSGASVNVLNQETVDRTKAPNSNFHLIPKLIHAYGTKQLFSWHWWPIYGNHFYSQQQINRSHFLCFAPNLDVLSVLCPQQPLIFCKSISRTSLCNTKTFKFIQSSTNTANCSVELVTWKRSRSNCKSMKLPALWLIPWRIPPGMKAKVNVKLEERHNEGTIVKVALTEVSCYHHYLLHTGQSPTPFRSHYIGYFPNQFILQDLIQDLIRKTPGTANISDNIWIWQTFG